MCEHFPPTSGAVAVDVGRDESGMSRVTGACAVLAAHAMLAIAGIAPSARAQAPHAAVALDSVVLVVTECYGTCPAYRASLSAGGRTSLEPRGPVDRGPIRFGVIAPESLSIVLDLARDIGFTSLPDTIANNAELCPSPATDFSSVIVTLFQRGAQKSVMDYQGCFAPMARDSTGRRIFSLHPVPALRPLRSFEARIDAMIWRTTAPSKPDH